MARKIKPSAIKSEGDITSNNIVQLMLDPVQGKFDAEHLKEINRRVLENIPSYHGGEYRQNTGEHVRSRSVDDGKSPYVVHYKNDGVTDKDINDAMSKLGDINELGKLPKDEFAKKMSELYGDLDYIHPFTEANSRSLRLFTEQIASKAGYELDWPNTNVNKSARDELYKARDLEVSKRSHPDLTIDKMREATTTQIEAYETQKFLRNAKPLETIFKENIDRPKTINNDNLFQEQIFSSPNPYAKGKSQVEAVTKGSEAKQTVMKQPQAATQKTVQKTPPHSMSKGKR